VTRPIQNQTDIMKNMWYCALFSSVCNASIIMMKFIRHAGRTQVQNNIQWQIDKQTRRQTDRCKQHYMKREN